MPGILYEQDYDGCGDVLSPPREGRLSISHSSQETISIFPSAHHIRGNAVPGTSHISKVRLHRPDFKVECEDRHFRREVPAKDSHKGVDPKRFCCRIYSSLGT
jgi:hypothetical protein